MGLFRWFTKNWANTTEPSHPDLTPLVVPLATDATAVLVQKAVATLAHWRIASQEPGEFKLTRRTRFIGFVDDVTVTLEPAGPGTMIHATSKSRIGIGDLGQNRRNILELWAAVRAEQGST